MRNIEGGRLFGMVDQERKPVAQGEPTISKVQKDSNPIAVCAEIEAYMLAVVACIREDSRKNVETTILLPKGFDLDCMRLNQYAKDLTKRNPGVNIIVRRGVRNRLFGRDIETVIIRAREEHTSTQPTNAARQ